MIKWMYKIFPGKETKDMHVGISHTTNGGTMGEYLTKIMAEEFNTWKEWYKKDIYIFQCVLESNYPNHYKEGNLYKNLDNLLEEVDSFSAETGKATYRGTEICTPMKLAFCLGEYSGSLSKIVEESGLKSPCKEVLLSKHERILLIFQI